MIHRPFASALFRIPWTALFVGVGVLLAAPMIGWAAPTAILPGGGWQTNSAGATLSLVGTSALTTVANGYSGTSFADPSNFGPQVPLSTTGTNFSTNPVGTQVTSGTDIAYAAGNSIVPSHFNGAGPYQPGTTAAIIAGAYPGTTPTMSMRTRAPNEISNPGPPATLPSGFAYLASDVVNLQGMAQGMSYALQMDYAPNVESTDPVSSGVPSPTSDAYYDAPGGRLFLGVLSAMPGGGETIWHNSNVNNVDTVGSWVPVTVGRKTTYVWQPGAPAVGTLAFGWAQPNNVTGWLTTVGSGGNTEAYGSGSPYDGKVVKNGSTYVNDANHPYLGSFADFWAEVTTSSPTTGGGPVTSLDQIRSAWGIDVTNHTAWAVLDQAAGVFAVVPEPSTFSLLASGGCCLGAVAWRKHRQAQKRRTVAKKA